MFLISVFEPRNFSRPRRDTVGRCQCRRYAKQMRRPVPGLLAVRAEFQRVLTEENVQAVLHEAKETFSTVFGSEENRQVGITGEVSLVGIDGATVVLALKGQFWHQRVVVLQRLDKFIRDRIPECIEVVALEGTTPDTDEFDNRRF
ncbi:hypothetical protein, conserved [Cyanidioschyzon merolae strain 10D]|uniref:Uncharacterized protein n=1 Tax=Cyanidioschyzon merolae (strain NIES-3377 / 10D) TaxID=280699 RepID=M1UXP2_CYAM1|nr:hypothetical protein, conserved [Cyanidioschyzon merolae strain 10D]BAM83266.1 hypothetical protein, conserved [Cyanidioschyzon merolae strain 10D]|eukprot:XP_005539302.1 hypothetical protein, conserved [Cyanidioschyzon merolae strain 10D]